MNGINAYRENAIATQSSGRLVVLLYDGAIKYLKQALKELEAGHHAAKGEYINKAVAIVNELDASLDVDAGGDVATNLRSLYHFMIRHLGEANIYRDPRRIQDVIACLQSLNDGWKSVTR